MHLYRELDRTVPRMFFFRIPCAMVRAMARNVDPSSLDDAKVSIWRQALIHWARRGRLATL